jgi:hypothetical protein
MPKRPPGPLCHFAPDANFAETTFGRLRSAAQNAVDDVIEDFPPEVVVKLKDRD